MSWKGDEDDQRFWNLIIYKMYLSDKEMEEAAPFMLGVFAVIAVIGILVWIFL